MLISPSCAASYGNHGHRTLLRLRSLYARKIYRIPKKVLSSYVDKILNAETWYFAKSRKEEDQVIEQLMQIK
jgi:hypothetical protein